MTGMQLHPFLSKQWSETKTNNFEFDKFNL